jgi:uncharacterized membrane protein YhaH (DUF805 family)
MLYILLIIIAIGVLLASQAGKQLLDLILVVLGIGAICYVGFWVVIFLIGILSDRSAMNSIGGVGEIFVVFIFACLIIGATGLWIRRTHDRFKSGEYSIKKMARGIKFLLIESWKKHKVGMTFLILLFSFTAFMIVWAIVASIATNGG